MNDTQETLRLLGQPTDQMNNFIKAALATPDHALAKAISPAFAGRLQATAPGYSEVSEATLKILGDLGLGEFGNLYKTISTGTGLVAYDLQAPAKNLYPFYAPIRNVLPRVGGGVGTATNWRQVNAIIGSGFDNMGWVPEGQRSGVMSYNTSNKSATYVTIGEEDAATYEAISAGRQFEDIQTMMTFRLLQKMMLKEEMALLGGNATMPLATPATPTVSTVVVTGQTLPSATYYVQVAALTLEGYQNASRSGVLSAATSLVQTGADGKTYTLNGGTGPVSALSAGQASGSNSVTMTTAAVPGAVGYAWFIGTTNSAGTGRLQVVTTLNSWVQSAALNTTGQLASALAADYSVNANYAFDGLLTTALKAGSGAYVSTLPTGVAGTGTALTASGRGSVNEIDTMFQTMWDNFQVSPTIMYVNSQELKNITTKVLTGASSAPLLRYNEDAGGGGYNGLVASGSVRYYYNPFAPPDTGEMIPIKVHPKIPPGMILAWAQNLPVQYQSNEVPNVAEVKVRQDYYQIDWPIVTRQRQVGVYAEEVLAVYAPFAMGVIQNIANG